MKVPRCERWFFETALVHLFDKAGIFSQLGISRVKSAPRELAINRQSAKAGATGYVGDQLGPLIEPEPLARSQTVGPAISMAVCSPLSVAPGRMHEAAVSARSDRRRRNADRDFTRLSLGPSHSTNQHFQFYTETLRQQIKIP